MTCQSPIAAIARADRAEYPHPPFDPPESYAELARGFPGAPKTTDPRNAVYGAVREALQRMGLDAEHAGTPEWTPFRGLIRPGQRAVIKPNFVKGAHPLGEPGVASLITHASVMRPLIDYILQAANGDANIAICDAPLQSSVWDDIVGKSGAAALVEEYARRGVAIGLMDLRREVSVFNEENIVIRREVRDRDPRGYVIVDLKDRSALMPLYAQPRCRLEITDYPLRIVSERHNRETNEYLISRTVLESDFFLCVPKLKTHKKAGLTGAMKNLVGIVGDKSWIAHHRRGAPRNGGDEFPIAHPIPVLQYRMWNALKARPALLPAATALKRMARRVLWKGKSLEEFRMRPAPDSQVYEGGWHGNDTVWRCVVDLNNILWFADREGRMRETPQRSYLAVMDGILAGEGEGPLEQTPRADGAILAAAHPVVCDYAAAAFMGFDPMRIQSVRGALRENPWPLTGFETDAIEIRASEAPDWPIPFRPPAHWVGHIEATREKSGAASASALFTR